MMLQRLSNCSRMSSVPSVDALSTTTISLSGYFWASTDSRQRLINRPLLYVTIVTETRSLCAMNKNLNDRACVRASVSFLPGPRCYCFLPPSENQRPRGHPHDPSINCQWFEAARQNGLRNRPRDRAGRHSQTHGTESAWTEMLGRVLQ